MKRASFIIASIIFIFISPIISLSSDREIPFTEKDRERLIRLEAEVEEGFKAIDKRFDAIDNRFEAIDKRFDAIDKRFESIENRFVSIDKQFDRMTNLLVGIILAFASIVAVTITFAIWDRRTMIRPFEKKIKDIEDELAENRSKLHSLLDALRALGKRNEDVAEILKRFNLL